MRKLILFTLLAFTANQVNAQWQILNGPIAPAAALLISGDYVFAGLKNGSYSGVYRSSDNGSTWVSANSGEVTYDISALAKNGDYIYAAQNAKVYLTSNNGANWSNVSNGLPINNVNTLAVKEGAVYAGTQNVYKTTDNGLIWNNITSGWNGHVSSLAVQGVIIMAGTLTQGIYLSTDNGLTWNSANTGLPSQVNTVAIFGSTLLAGTANGVYLSTDMGDTWNVSDLTDGINAFTIVGSNIFAGCENDGVFISTANGANWENISEGLDLTGVACLAANDEYLFAGILGSYVCRRPLSEIIVTGINETRNSEKVQVFPNPASGIVNITLKDVAREMQVRVYSATGKEMAGSTYQNHNSLRLDVSGFPKGLYFVKIETESGSVLKKVVVY